MPRRDSEELHRSTSASGAHVQEHSNYEEYRSPLSRYRSVNLSRAYFTLVDEPCTAWILEGGIDERSWKLPKIGCRYALGSLSISLYESLAISVAKCCLLIGHHSDVHLP